MMISKHPPGFPRPPVDWGYAAEAFLLLGLARLAIQVCPFRILSRHLGTPNRESQLVLPAEALAKAKRITWALGAAARFIPWESTCLARALAGRFMLHRRRIPSTFLLGLDVGGKSKLEAHAWLRCGVLMVAGGGEQGRFTSVATYADLDP